MSAPIFTVGSRARGRFVLPLILLASAAGSSLLAQGAPITGNASVTLTPSLARVNVGSTVTAELKVNLTGMTGKDPAGADTAVVLGAYTISVSFDKTKFQFVSATGGTDPRYPTSGLTYTNASSANSAGSVTLSSTQSDSSGPVGLVSLAVLTFSATSGGSATFTPNPDSLASAIKIGATVAGPSRIPASAFPAQITANTAPSADVKSASGAEDGPISVTLTGTDPQSDALTFSVFSGPAHGSLSGTAPSLTYQPVANYFGPDSFTYKASDGLLQSTAAIFSINVTAVNDAPVATPQSVTTNESTATAITLAGTDVEGSSLTFERLTSPSHGTITGTLPNLTFTPVAGYSGPDSFTFRVSDGSLFSSAATVSITVSAVVATVTALSPPSRCQASPDFELTVTGTNFVPGTQVLWDGVSRTTAFDSATQLRSTILSAEVGSPGTVAVAVQKPSAGTSSPVNFTVTADSTPPSVTPPSAITLQQTTCVVVGPNTVAGVTPATSGALTTFLTSGSASDGCSATTRLAAQVSGSDVTAGTLFTRGGNVVAFRFRDGASNVGSANQSVTVQVFGDLDLAAGVNASDLVVLSNYVVHNLNQGAPPFTAPLALANLNGDLLAGAPNIDSLDLVILSNYVVGNIKCLPLP